MVFFPLQKKTSVVLIAGILPDSSGSVRSAEYQIISPQPRFELRGRIIVTESR